MFRIQQTRPNFTCTKDTLKNVKLLTLSTSDCAEQAMPSCITNKTVTLWKNDSNKESKNNNKHEYNHIHKEDYNYKIIFLI
jgi:post-segregation antitoxin (ccd killing protein)